jgi:hypothetical protein
MAIVWPCTLSVDAYASAGEDIEVPRPNCPGCSAPMGFWWGYWRHVRDAGRCRRLFLRRGRCKACKTTHALLPSFLLLGRLDTAATVGGAVEQVAAGRGGARPAAARAGVPHTTARGWLRRFGRHAARFAVAFAALCVELGGEVVAASGRSAADAVAAMGAAFAAAAALPGWAGIGCFAFASAVSGGSLLAGNTNSLYLRVGRRRFMPPVPTTEGDDGHGTLRA